MYSLKIFFNYLLEIKVISHHPMGSLSFKCPVTNVREVLTRSEIQELYKACTTSRERVLLSIYYGCGLRRSEGVNLALKDIYLKDGLLYVRQGKKR